MGRIPLFSLLLSLSLPLGCGSPPDYRSSDGVSYFWRSASFEVSLVEEQENWFLGKLYDLNRFEQARVQRTLSLAEVEVFGDKISCGASSPTGYCNGLQLGDDLQVRDLGCPFNSALTHEMAHLILQDLTGDPDYYHQDPEIWPIADGAPRACP